MDDQDGSEKVCIRHGEDFQLLGVHHKAIKYYEKSVIGELREKPMEISVLPTAHSVTIEKQLKLSDRRVEGGAYGNLGDAHYSLGDYRKAIEYHERHLNIVIESEIGDRGEEGTATGNLGNVYKSLGEGRANGSLGNFYNILGDNQRAIDYIEKCLKIAVQIGDRDREGTIYGNLGNAYQSLGDYRKAIEYYEKQLNIAIEIGDRGREGTSYHNIGSAYCSLEQFENAVDNFVSAVNVFNFLRSLLKSKDYWKIKYRELYETTYTALWRSLLIIGKVDEALFTAEQGRAQTLSDNLSIQFKLPASLPPATFDTEGTISRLSTEIIAPTIFLAIDGFMINIWFLSRGNKILFRQGKLEGDRTEKDPIHALLQSTLVKIGTEVSVRCEDRTFDELDRECSFSILVQGEGVGKPPIPPVDNPFKPFYDAIIDPIVEMLGPQEDELVIVPDGALCFTPWAAVTESIRIRTVPSLTSYQLILTVPEGHHMRKGALLVGNPCLNQLKKPIPALPCAQEEVEMIASILNTRALVGRQATKAEVMKRMSSVGLIHIAAHGNKRTGEIALSPNPGWTSDIPHEKDYILQMSDVQAANLRARLVVLSCCHSGRGRISKGEGVVGIARAFLAAGARSVLVSLWAIDDRATMVFMKSFYQHLKEGKTASAAVQESMKFLRESKDYSKMKYWAPFQLIGDDVKIEFEAEDDVKK
ncbi:tetratricopeptide repeat protein 28-like [Acropora millepora]|uniref:tetratricopeptide repeat protein 28-like n=1 Tax=Acropora millepora TaxID=45264 RepID=UPI001CF5186B|nr:tetratricopeptide repeat protein 28-like [Acropora millepora]